jgi:hypothetical protein
MNNITLKHYTSVEQSRLKARGFAWNRSRKGWFRLDEATSIVFGIWRNPFSPLEWTLYINKSHSSDETWVPYRSLSDVLDSV